MKHAWKKENRIANGSIRGCNLHFTHINFLRHPCFPLFNQSILKCEPWHGISNNLVCATRKASDQPAHMRILSRAFVSGLPFATDWTDVAHSIGVQNGVLHFFLLYGTDFWCSGHFFVLKLKVYVCLVKSFLILSFLFIKTVQGKPKNPKFGSKTAVTL